MCRETENGSDVYWRGFLSSADAVLAELGPKLQPQAEPVAWPKADDSAKELGWSWDYKWLESLADATRAAGWEASMEAIDFVLSRVAAPQAPPDLVTQLDHARRRIGQLTIQLGEVMKAQPAAVAVPAEKRIDDPASLSLDEGYEAAAYVRGWNACREAMIEAAPQPQPQPVAWDDWIDRCHFWVTFDGETTHQLTFGGYTADANGINSMTFELSGVVSRDDLDELDDAIDEAMRVADTGADRARIKEAYGRIRPLLSELATGEMR
jgi:hypothetical protein